MVNGDIYLYNCVFSVIPDGESDGGADRCFPALKQFEVKC